MSHSFSITSIKAAESYLDENVKILRRKIEGYAKANEAFDLKKLFHYYTIDVLGELAFSQSFNVQLTGDESRVPPVKDHTLLGSVTGAWPAMTHTLKAWLPRLPHKYMKSLFKARADCAQLASECVQRRTHDLQDAKDMGDAQRKDILTNLILAKHPDTGERISRTDLEAEAFGFL
jgi:cytochrome P450